MTGMPLASEGARRPATTPWGAVLLVAVVFLIVEHSIFASASTGPLASMQDYSATVTAGSGVRPVALIILALGAIGSIPHRNRRGLVRAAPNVLGWLMVGFALLALASALWSDNRMFTIRRLAAMATVAVAAVAYRRMPGDSFLRLVFLVTLGYLAAGLAREAMLGTFHPWNPGYRFSGTLSPNIQGVNCALLFFSGLSLARARGRRRLALAFVLLLALFCLFLARSRTALGALVVAASFYAFLSLVRARPLLLWASLCLAASVAALAILVGQGSTALPEALELGRVDSDPATLTGRTQLWEECLSYARAKPWFGYGYDGFWFPDRIMEVSKAVRWPIRHAHSVYLEVMLGLGGFGLFTYVSIFALGIWRAAKVAFATGNAADLFVAALLVYCAVQGLLEPTVVTLSLLSFLCMTALARLGFPTHLPGEEAVEG